MLKIQPDVKWHFIVSLSYLISDSIYIIYTLLYSFSRYRAGLPLLLSIARFMVLSFAGSTRLRDFTVEVSNDSITYTQCCYHPGKIPRGGSETLQCDSPLIARFVRIHLSRHLFTVCEVIVTGNPYISTSISLHIYIKRAATKIHVRHKGKQNICNSIGNNYMYSE